MAWNYNDQDYKDSKITIAAGEHRVRIANVEPKISSTGRSMYKITLDVSNSAFKIYHYLVFMEDNQRMTNANIGQIKDSFGVSPAIDPDAKPLGWIGAVGAAKVKLDEEDRPKIAYFIEKSKQDKLPAWVEVASASAGHNDTPAPGRLGSGVHFPTGDDITSSPTDLPFDL